MASLDAEKAYDSLWRDGLFEKLIPKIDPNIWFLLKNYYNSSEGVLKINNVIMKDTIKITREVKQGGVISPFLFIVLIDELIQEISRDFEGCTLGNIKTII